MRETAYAKINLALHVRARRADGYHEIESLFAFCEHGDVLEASIRDDGALTLAIDGPCARGLAADESNLVMRAARAMQGGAGADVRLTKNLPVASGIGGGSADAAAAARLLVRLWSADGTEADIVARIGPLGADIPACVSATSVLVKGIGEALTPCDAGIGGTPVLLVNPGKPVATAAVFALWDGVDRGPLEPADWMQARNDLEAPAMMLCPEIAEVLAALNTCSPMLARMSGSGATCFALFDHAAQRDAAHSAIRASHPDWWTMPSRIR